MPFGQTFKTPKKPDSKEDEKKLRAARLGANVAKNLIGGNLEKAFARTIVSGIKLAEANPFVNPAVNPLKLAQELRLIGIGVLGWTPETLFSVIDRMYNGWSEEKAAKALEEFHDTGNIVTDVPSLVRQKIYAIRIVATSDIAHNEWHIFEKVGCAFNDRVAQFGVVEKLTPGECARAVSVIEHIRPDQDGYSKEIKAYVGASCHEDGILTLSPSKYLRFADEDLRMFNYQADGNRIKPEAIGIIRRKYDAIKEADKSTLNLVEDISTIQALKLLAIDTMGDEVAL